MLPLQQTGVTLSNQILTAASVLPGPGRFMVAHIGSLRRGIAHPTSIPPGRNTNSDGSPFRLKSRQRARESYVSPHSCHNFKLHGYTHSLWHADCFLSGALRSFREYNSQRAASRIARSRRGTRTQTEYTMKPISHSRLVSHSARYHMDYYPVRARCALLAREWVSLCVAQWRGSDSMETSC